MIGTALIAGALWTLLSSSPNEVYMGHSRPYSQLFELCEGKGGRACCRASVRAMREAGTFPVEVGGECPGGEKVVSLRCPASMNWCAEISPQELSRADR